MSAHFALGSLEKKKTRTRIFTRAYQDRELNLGGILGDDAFVLLASPPPPFSDCLLYTSDAADDTPCVDL
eukprot:487962-Pyramimonas_sp.AAC.1